MRVLWVGRSVSWGFVELQERRAREEEARWVKRKLELVLERRNW